MLILRRFLLTLLAVGVVVAVARVRSASRVAQELKLDLAEIDDLRYGLLDVEAWLDHLVTVLDRQIDGFRETPVQREEVRIVLEETIREVITGVERTIRDENETRSWGTLRQLATDFVVDFDALRASSGEYADIAIDRLDQPENRDRLKDFMRARVDAFADSTFAPTDRSAFDAVLARRGCASRDDCRAVMNEELGARNDALASTAAVAIALVLAMLLLVWRPRARPGGVELACLLIGVFALLYGGLFTPMIDIEAEITRLDLVLVGEPIAFEHQVLFFQSKSIIDVVDLLVRTARWDLVLVGVGIGLFSVVFPLCKLGATILYQYAERLRRARPVRFFALESGKWSMADVFVVAMFLAFLGFDGLTGSQLAALVTDSPNASLATENGTQLRVGFHLFAAFCLAGFALSSLAKRESRPPEEASLDLDPETRPRSGASV